MWIRSALEDSLPSFLKDDIPDIPTQKIEEMLESSRFDTFDLCRASSRHFEGKGAIPMMTISFHRHLFENGMIPSPDEYVEEYEKENNDFMMMVGGDDVEGVRHRVMRAYPSLVRDVHFVYCCRDMGCHAIRTVRDDISGVDARIPVESGDVKVRLFYDSPRSRSHKMMKAFSHIMGPDHFDLGISKRDGVMRGDFILYSKQVIRAFLISVGVEEGSLTPDS